MAVASLFRPVAGKAPSIRVGAPGAGAEITHRGPPMIAPTIVVPLDASEHALVALPVAKRLAELEAATLHLVHVAPEASPPLDVLERLGLNSTGLRGSVLDMKAGEPSAGIVQAASELHATLIVMCTHTAVSHVDKTL